MCRIAFLSLITVLMAGEKREGMEGSVQVWINAYGRPVMLLFKGKRALLFHINCPVHFHSFTDTKVLISSLIYLWWTGQSSSMAVLPEI